jgi:hypothetical protein
LEGQETSQPEPELEIGPIDLVTIEDLFMQIAERLRQGKRTLVKDSKLLYWELYPVETDAFRIRLKCTKLQFSEWLLDNVLCDISRWNHFFGTGVYVLSHPQTFNNSYLDSGARGFRLIGCFCVETSEGYYEPVANYGGSQGIYIQIVPMIETRTDVVISCTGPRLVTGLWNAYDFMVKQFQSFAKVLDDQVRDTVPLSTSSSQSSEESLRAKVYLYRRKPNPETARRNETIYEEACAGIPHKELGKKYHLSVNTIRYIIQMERKRRGEQIEVEHDEDKQAG